MASVVGQWTSELMYDRQIKKPEEHTMFRGSYIYILFKKKRQKNKTQYNTGNTRFECFRESVNNENNDWGWN